MKSRGERALDSTIVLKAHQSGAIFSTSGVSLAITSRRLPTYREPNQTSGSSHAHSYRSDIQGLRAVAVGTVLLYHAGARFLPGGFIGVDVFFVISGFLITGLLVKEIQNTGSVSLSSFYARRIKRIVPAASIVIVVAIICSVTFLPRNRWESIGNESLGASLNVVNWIFASTSTDYLRQDQAASPLQHFWTLAVEEQFYLIWPILLVGACLFAGQRNRRQGSRRNPNDALGYARVAVVILTVLSFGFSVYYTQINPQSAYFVTTTRIWELGMGAIVALYAKTLSKLNRQVAGTVGWLGLGAILFAVFYISGETGYPGTAALMPTLGASAIIVSGMGGRATTGVGALLSLAPFVWVGNISYSLYLWHWPMIVIGMYMLGSFPLQAGLLIVALSFAPAYLSYRYVERPLMNWKYIAPNATALGLGLIAVCCTSFLALGMLLIPKPVNEAAFQAKELSTGSAVTPEDESPRGAEVLDVDPSAGVPKDKESEFFPLAMYAAEDTPDTVSLGCHQGVQEDNAEACVFGVEESDYRIALVGDSHAAQWTPAISRLAQEKGWRVESYTKSSCALVGTLIMAEGDEETYDTCLSWHDNVMKELTGPDRPDLVLTSGQAYKTADGGPFEVSLANTWKRLEEAGITVAAIADTPRPGINVPECALSHEDKLTECAVDRPTAMRNGLQAQRRAAELVDGVEILDMNDKICPADSCSVVIGGIFVYRDSNHITATYSRTLAESLGSEITNLGIK